MLAVCLRQPNCARPLGVREKTSLPPGRRLEASSRRPFYFKRWNRKSWAQSEAPRSRIGVTEGWHALGGEGRSERESIDECGDDVSIRKLSSSSSLLTAHTLNRYRFTARCVRPGWLESHRKLEKHANLRKAARCVFFPLPLCGLRKHAPLSHGKRAAICKTLSVLSGLNHSAGRNEKKSLLAGARFVRLVRGGRSCRTGGPTQLTENASLSLGTCPGGG